MNTILRYTVKPLGNITKRLGACGNVGIIVGVIVGGILSLLKLVHGQNLVLTPQELFWVGLMLTLFSWLVINFILVMLLRVQFSSVAVQTLFNAFLVTCITLLICHISGQYMWAWLIGIFVGIFIGYILCKIIDRITG